MVAAATAFDQNYVTDLITIPLFTGVIGYVTNWTGVLMLFRPLRFRGVRLPGLKILFPLLPRMVQVLPLFRYDGRIGWQGIVPSRADKMASIAVDKGLAKLGGISDFYRELEPDRIAEHLATVARAEIRDVVEQIMRREHPQLWRDLPPVIREAVHARVQQQLPAIVRDLTDLIGANIDQLIDAKLMVIRYFEAHPELLNSLFQEIGHKELRFMQNFGFYFGFPMGFVLFGVVQLVPYWWVLPAGGMIIGWVANYLGLTMIFEPIFPNRFVPWRQGLFIKRKDEVTEGYARLISTHVITLSNLGDELLHGPRSDRTHQMLEDTLRPAVDRAVGRARSAVRVAVGTREYDQIRSALAAQAAGLAPITFADAELNRTQAGKIYSYVAAQMKKMGPDEFVEMLRSAIRQDEWLLFVHGGVLGILAGLIHLAIFGV
ncbi:MAG TPA: hypothetical protein VFV67_13735 [Actinophytocola sp.]|uniref:hypothetical protein n=1 Tax=Actinophytocola sp. TaxID=1872138 RepID=UPI002DBF2FA7|nr:hypothetical protein [Actinophytocola sp.]HEU5471707.1 hypothetical protein [Actinophytocola sp.]